MKVLSNKIFVLFGFSASGKDTLLDMVSSHLSIPFIASHTSRPQNNIGETECICALDTVGVKELKRIYGDRVISIFVNCSEPIRRARAMARGNFDIVEWERRLKDDKKIFSQLDFEEFDFIIDNSKMPETAFNELSMYIKSIKGE